MGPTWGQWWDDGATDALTVRFPVQDQESFELTELVVTPWKVTEGYWWDYNSAQWASHGAYENWLVLGVAPENNTHLESGAVYQSPPTSLPVFQGLGWHSGKTLERFPLRVQFTAP